MSIYLDLGNEGFFHLDCFRKDTYLEWNKESKSEKDMDKDTDQSISSSFFSCAEVFDEIRNHGDREAYVVVGRLKMLKKAGEAKKKLVYICVSNNAERKLFFAHDSHGQLGEDFKVDAKILEEASSDQFCAVSLLQRGKIFGSKEFLQPPGAASLVAEPSSRRAQQLKRRRIHGPVIEIPTCFPFEETSKNDDKRTGMKRTHLTNTKVTFLKKNTKETEIKNRNYIIDLDVIDRASEGALEVPITVTQMAEAIRDLNNKNLNDDQKGLIGVSLFENLSWQHKPVLPEIKSNTRIDNLTLDIDQFIVELGPGGGCIYLYAENKSEYFNRLFVDICQDVFLGGCNETLAWKMVKFSRNEFAKGHGTGERHFMLFSCCISLMYVSTANSLRKPHAHEGRAKGIPSTPWFSELDD